MVAIWTLAGEGELFGEEVASRSRKILPNLLIPSAEKVSQPTIFQGREFQLRLDAIRRDFLPQIKDRPFTPEEKADISSRRD
jgi:hypothetical protein